MAGRQCRLRRCDLREVAIKLHQVNAVSYRSTVSSDNNAQVPYVLDIKKIMTDPELLKLTAKCLWMLGAHRTNISFFCCKTYAVIPMTTLIAVETNIPFLIADRKEGLVNTKNIGPSQQCVLIEDVIGRGGKTLRTIEQLRQQGLNVKTVFGVLDEGLDKKKFDECEVRVYSLFTISSLAELHVTEELLDRSLYEGVAYYIDAARYGFSIDVIRKCYRMTVVKPLRSWCDIDALNPEQREQQLVRMKETAQRRAKTVRRILYKWRAINLEECHRCNRVHANYRFSVNRDFLDFEEFD